MDSLFNGCALGQIGMHIYIVASLQHWLMFHLFATTSNLLFEFFEGPINPIIVVGGW
jgi:hypothetical protein